MRACVVHGHAGPVEVVPADLLHYRAVRAGRRLPKVVGERRCVDRLALPRTTAAVTDRMADTRPAFRCGLPSACQPHAPSRQARPCSTASSRRDFLHGLESPLAHGRLYINSVRTLRARVPGKPCKLNRAAPRPQCLRRTGRKGPGRPPGPRSRASAAPLGTARASPTRCTRHPTQRCVRHAFGGSWLRWSCEAGRTAVCCPLPCNYFPVQCTRVRGDGARRLRPLLARKGASRLQVRCAVTNMDLQRLSAKAVPKLPHHQVPVHLERTMERTITECISREPGGDPRRTCSTPAAPKNTSTAMAAGSCTADPGNCASCPRRSQRRRRCLHKEDSGAPCKLPASVNEA